ncbi:MAG TPA: hypothetical protein VM537_08105 [Anaerolineae bacterium]|nr:hypothetical protein [Anaerolineae bacterium]
MRVLKSEMLSFRATPDEKARIWAEAASLNMTPGRLMRLKALGSELKVWSPTELKELLEASLLEFVQDQVREEIAQLERAGGQID